MVIFFRVGKQRLREAKIQAADYLILLLAGAALGTLAKVSDETFGALGYTYTVIAICKLENHDLEALYHIPVPLELYLIYFVVMDLNLFSILWVARLNHVMLPCILYTCNDSEDASIVQY